MLNRKKKVEPLQPNGNAAKPIVIRGCDLKGKSPTLGLALMYAENAKTNAEFLFDAEFVKALLNEVVQSEQKRNLV